MRVCKINAVLVIWQVFQVANRVLEFSYCVIAYQLRRKVQTNSRLSLYEQRSPGVAKQNNNLSSSIHDYKEETRTKKWNYIFIVKML
jgi:hypothetical protein